jgi:hypothetical protein
MSRRQALLEREAAARCQESILVSKDMRVK